MRSVSPWLAALAAVAVVAAVVVLAQEQAEPAPGPTLAVPGEQPPVVAAMPYKYETEYDLDPFEPDKLRRTRTVVTHVLVVRSDGTTAVKPAS